MTGPQWAALLTPLIPAVGALILAGAAHLKAGAAKTQAADAQAQAGQAAVQCAAHASATHDQVHPYPPDPENISPPKGPVA